MPHHPHTFDAGNPFSRHYVWNMLTLHPLRYAGKWLHPAEGKPGKSFVRDLVKQINSHPGPRGSGPFFLSCCFARLPLDNTPKIKLIVQGDVGWGVSKRTLSNTWSFLFLSAPLHVKTQKQSNRHKHDTLHQRSLTLLGRFWKWEALREMRRDTINPHGTSSSNNVSAQITISLPGGMAHGYLSKTVSFCKFRKVFLYSLTLQSEFKWTLDGATLSNSDVK